MLVCIVGPTCSGKSTLEKKLTKTGVFGRIISFTTRKPRTGEVNGKDYYFLDKPPFADEVAELNYFNGNYYGVLLDEFLDKTNQGKDVVIVVDPNGLNQFKRICTEYNVPITSVYLQQDIRTLMERFFERSRDDKGMDPKTFSKRAVSMFSEWLTWGEQYVYDLVFEDFGPDTEQDLIRMLTNDKN